MPYGSNITREIYFRSPYALRNLMSSLYGLQQRRKRYGDQYPGHLEFLRSAQTLSEPEILKIRNEKTVQFINEALQNSPYYKGNVNYHPIKDTAEIAGFPILSGKETRVHQVELVPAGLKTIPHTWSHTSGTTGKSLVFPVTLDCFRREYAFRGLHYEWGRATLHGRQPFAFCAGHPVAHPDRNKPPFWTYDHANNWLLLSSYHLSGPNLVHYVRELERFSPVLIGGYPSSIYLLALACVRHGPGKIRPLSVYTSSETLYDYQRKTIEEAFGAKVFNWYGNSEMVANIVECEKGELHLKHEHSYVEVLGADDLPCNPGETGRLVCTGFGNRAFPLIRYDIGDNVTISGNQVSKCGRNGLIVESVDGRKEDYITTPDGRLVGRLDHLFKDSRNVCEAQIFQETPGEVVLRIVKADGYALSDEQAILREARLRLGSGIIIRFEYPASIKRNNNGKFRFIVSKVDQQQAINNNINP